MNLVQNLKVDFQKASAEDPTYQSASQIYAPTSEDPYR